MKDVYCEDCKWYEYICEDQRCWDHCNKTVPYKKTPIRMETRTLDPYVDNEDNNCNHYESKTTEGFE